LLFKSPLIAVFCITVSACGFQPLYGSKGSSNIVADLSDVRVAPIKNRVGQLLSNELKHLLNPLRTSISPKYYLVIKLTQTTRSLAVKKTALATRANLLIISSYRLIDTKSQQILTKAKNSITVSYNIYSSQYATISAEKEATKRATKELAHDIRLQIGVFFKNHNKQSVLQ